MAAPAAEEVNHIYNQALGDEFLVRRH